MRIRIHRNCINNTICSDYQAPSSDSKFSKWETRSTQLSDEPSTMTIIVLLMIIITINDDMMIMIMMMMKMMMVTLMVKIALFPLCSGRLMCMMLRFESHTIDDDDDDNDDDDDDNDADGWW